MDENSKTKISAVIDAAATEYGVAARGIIGVSRQRDISEARHVAMMLAHDCLKCDMLTISEVFGRCYSTTTFAIRKIKDLASVDRKTSDHIRRIKYTLGITE